MKVNGTEKAYEQVRPGRVDASSDSRSKEVQNQIAEARKSLESVSVDKELNEEEKEKKRKEIQQRITELNKQLRQRQIELQREQQEKRKEMLQKANQEAETAEKNILEETEPIEGISQTGMKAMISADSAIRRAAAHGNMAQSFEGRVRVLEGEIAQDTERGRDVSQKEQELKKLTRKATGLHGAKFGYLTDAAREMKHAARKEYQPDGSGKPQEKDGSVRPMRFPAPSVPPKKTDIYVKGTMFSNVEFHF